MYNKDIAGNDLQTIITQALEDMKHELGVTSDTTTDMIHINLAELERRTGISRGKLRGRASDPSPADCLRSGDLPGRLYRRDRLQAQE